MGRFKPATAIVAILLAAPAWAEHGRMHAQDGHADRSVQHHHRWDGDGHRSGPRHNGPGDGHAARASRRAYYSRQYDAPPTVYGYFSPAFALHLLARDAYNAFH
jgi:hypothetical protein